MRIQQKLVEAMHEFTMEIRCVLMLCYKTWNLLPMRLNSFGFFFVQLVDVIQLKKRFYENKGENKYVASVHKKYATYVKHSGSLNYVFPFHHPLQNCNQILVFNKIINFLQNLLKIQLITLSN